VKCTVTGTKRLMLYHVPKHRIHKTKLWPESYSVNPA